MYLVLGVICLVLGGVALYVSHRENHRIGLITGTPTSPSNQLRCAGYYEVKGRIEAERTLDMPGTGKPCVWFHVKVQQEEVRGYGNRRNRSWVTVRDESLDVPFKVRDATGAVQVLPAGAEVDAPETFYDSERAGWLETMFAGRGACTGQRVSVTALAVGTQVYVLGPVRRQGKELAFQRSGKLPFIVSHRTEDELVGKKKTMAYGMLVAGFVALVGGVALILMGLRA